MPLGFFERLAMVKTSLLKEKDDNGEGIPNTLTEAVSQKNWF